MKLFAREGSPHAQKVLVAAQYASASVDVVTDAPEKAIKGKASADRLPLLETPEGCLFESNAIMTFLAKGDTGLCGADAFASAQIRSWMDFSLNEVEVPAAMWTYPIVGYMENYPEVTAKAQKDLKAALTVLEGHLKKETYLVGRRITLADIAVACALVLPMKLVLDDKARKAFTATTRWFVTCVNQPEFAKVLGPVTLIKKALASKAAAKSSGAAKPAAVAAAPAAAANEAAAAEKKAGNPLDSLPKSSLNLDSWKRQYSNAPDRDCFKAMPWFWENLDKAGYSVYMCKYNYNEDLKVSFQVSNLCGGFVQRCDEVRRYAFGTLQILGKEGGPIEIVGCWLFRGPDEKPLLECNPDAEYYTWTKVTEFSDAEKQAIAEMWCSEETINGKPILDCKVFK